METWISQLKWDEQGLIPAIAQDHKSKQVLMMAWMNNLALQLSLKENRAIYWSRSRQKIWRKGEASGNIQIIKSIHCDCDQDVILLLVEQIGNIACHTGRAHCFFNQLLENQWKITESIVKSPENMYPNHGQ